MRKLPYLVVLIAALPLALAACGGPSEPSTSLRVTMTDFAFSPNSFTVPAGQPISVEIANNGAVAHSFIIMQAGQDVKTHFTDTDRGKIYWEVASVPPGESVKESFTAPSAAGEYQIVCGVGGHFEAGMVAKLNVVSAP